MRNALRALAALIFLAAPAFAAVDTPLQVKTIGGSLAGTIAVGGTFQTLFASTPSRLGCQVINPPTATETIYIFIGSGSATTSASIPLVPSGVFTCNFGGVVLTDKISVEATTTSHAFIYMSE